MAQITIDGTKKFTDKLANKTLRRLANDLAILQKQQISDSFRRGGQPSKKWPPMWADKFVGRVPERAAGALTNAQSEFYRATNSKNPSAQRIARAQLRLQRASERAIEATSYRRGGQRLVDDGGLAASFFTKHNFVFGSEKTIIVTVASSAFYAKWQQQGFSSKGPNFIPLTKKAKREHRRGVNPEHEGLVQGIDYVMAWRGVKVPASPMIDYADAVNKKQIDDTATLNLKKG